MEPTQDLAQQRHSELTSVTGGRPDLPQRRLAADPRFVAATIGVNAIATSFGKAIAGFEGFVALVSRLVEDLDELVDQDGREVWLSAGEVELDQWVGRVIQSRDAVRRQLSPPASGV